MNYRIIRYRVVPEQVDENVRLVRAVFAQLHEAALPGVRYATLATDAGEFFHLVATATDDTPGPPSLPAFQAFQRDIEARLAEGPHPSPVRIVGDYRMLDGAGAPA